MFSVQLIFILCICLKTATGQACDASSDTPQCSIGEICSGNKCEVAVSCSDGSDCSGAGQRCMSDYCQSRFCHYSGECVHGQVCQHDNFRSCAYPVLLEANEGSNVTLTIAAPSALGTYDAISWYKEERTWNEIADMNRVFLNRWYNGLRTKNNKVKVNTTTGELTLINVTIEDEGFYYYEFDTNSEGISDTGDKYEYRLKLNVYPEAIIQGVPDKPVKDGTKLTLTCIPVKVNSQYTKMYWVVGGRNESGTTIKGGGALANILVHEVTKEDEGNPITCVVVPRFTDVITVKKWVKFGNAPGGQPVIQVSTMGQYNGEKVTLTCENPKDEGNPPCYAYKWLKPGGNIDYLPTTQNYTFIMDELHAGNYHCVYRNEFGWSFFSDAVEILYLGERPRDNKWLIAGCVIGVLVLTVLVVVAVFICKKYNIKLIIQTKSRDQGSKEAGEKDNQAYEIPVNEVEPSKTDTNNEYAEPTDRPKSEMGQYQVINEDEMDKDGQTGFVNTAFTTYEEVQVGKPELKNTATSII